MPECSKVKWKAASLGPERRIAGHHVPTGHDKWELYNTETGRCVLNDLSSTHPEIVKELDDIWQTWSKRCQKDKAEQ